MLGATQKLLSTVEELIYTHPLQYEWARTSIIFTDPNALLEGLSILEDILTWRELRVGKPDEPA
jgi:hypothetical protein